MMELFSTDYALLAAQRALSGSVTSELRALDVKCYPESDTLYLRFYYDGKASEERIDLWECVITEASAALGPDCNLDAAIIRLDYPEKIPLHGRYAYLRKEPVILKPVNPFQGKLLVQREPVHFQNEIGKFVSPIDETSINTQWGIAHIYGGVSIFPARPKACPISTVPVAYAQLAIQRALLGTVIPELVVIVVDVQDSLLYIRIYYEGTVGKAMLEEWERVISKAWADFGPDYVLDGQIESVVYRQPIFFRGRYAYRRQEMQGRDPWSYVK